MPYRRAARTTRTLLAIAATCAASTGTAQAAPYVAGPALTDARVAPVYVATISPGEMISVGKPCRAKGKATRPTEVNAYTGTGRALSKQVRETVDGESFFAWRTPKGYVVSYDIRGGWFLNMTYGRVIVAAWCS